MGKNGKAKHRYEVDNPEAKKHLREIAGVIAKAMPDKWNFTLFLFPPDALFYISSADRDSGIEVIKEWIAKQEKEAGGGK